MRSSISREWIRTTGHTPPASITKMIRIALKREAEEEPPVPDDMNVDDMIHFHDYQKVVVYDNLRRFEDNMNLKLEQFLDSHTMNRKRLKPVGDPEKVSEALSQLVKSILTYPDESTNFGQSVLMVSQIMWSYIVNFMEFDLN